MRWGSRGVHVFGSMAAPRGTGRDGAVWEGEGVRGRWLHCFLLAEVVGTYQPTLKKTCATLRRHLL